MDIFQDRYLKHQENKKKYLDNELEKNKLTSPRVSKYLLTVMLLRHSQRKFNGKKVTDENIRDILWAIREAPSSCNRQAIYLKEIDSTLAEEYLVGGTNWLNKANKVYLVFADKLAYKSPNEKGFMPYLDAGFAIENALLIATYLGLGSCFVNPNIRQDKREVFLKEYGDDYFCGALSLGHYSKNSPRALKRPLEKVLR